MRSRPAFRAAGLVHLDPDTAMNPHSLRAALPRGRGRRACDRSGHARPSAQRFLLRAAARAPRRAQPGHGVLLFQQRRRGRGPCARAVWARARGGGRLRRPPRQWHRGHFSRRPARADGLDLSASLLSLQRDRRAFRAHGQHSAAGLHGRPRLPRGRAKLVAARPRAVPAGDGVHLRGLRCASRGRHGFAGPGGGRLRMGHRAAQATSRTATRRGASCPCWRVAMRSVRWAAAQWRTCVCWRISKPAPTAEPQRKRRERPAGQLVRQVCAATTARSSAFPVRCRP